MASYLRELTGCCFLSDHDDDGPACMAVHRIHELYADMLFAKHSYDDAVIHYIKVAHPLP